MTRSSPQFTAAQVLEAGQRAEADGRRDYALQFYHYLTENYASSHEAMIAREALNRLTSMQPVPLQAAPPDSIPIAQPFVQGRLPAAAGYGAVSPEVVPQANGRGAYQHELPRGNGALDPYSPGFRMPSVVRRPEEAQAAPKDYSLPGQLDRYRVGGMIATAVTVVGWLVVAAGIVAGVLGLGIVPSSGTIIDFIPGAIYFMGGLALGLGMVLGGKIARAVFDSANAARDLVAIEQAKLRQSRN